MTGIAPDEVLEEFNDREIDVETEDDPRFVSVVRRLDAICSVAAAHGVQLFIDAEESWFQNTVDALADEMMRRYNRERVVALNTFQLYRHDRLAFLERSYERAQEVVDSWDEDMLSPPDDDTL